MESRVSSLWTRWRLSGIAGLLFVGLSLVAAGVNVMPPAYDAGTAEFAGWLALHPATFRLWHVVAGLAFLLFYFPFFAGFCERLREAEGTPALWSRVAWAGAIISPAAGTTSGAFIMGVALLGERASPEVAVFAAAAQHYAYVVAGAYGGVAMLGAAIVILRTGIFWRWLGWVGAVLAVAAIVSIAALVENDPKGPLVTLNGLAWLAYFLWIAAVSVALLLVRPATAQSGRAHPSQAA